MLGKNYAKSGFCCRKDFRGWEYKSPTQGKVEVEFVCLLDLPGLTNPVEGSRLVIYRVLI